VRPAQDTASQSAPADAAADGRGPGIEELSLLYETSCRISTAMEIGDVVAAYLEQVAARGRYSCTVTLDERDEDGRVTNVILGRWTPQTGMLRTVERHRVADQLDPDGRLQAVLDRGQTLVINEIGTDPRVTPELRARLLQMGPPALVIMPLMVRGQRIGLVLLSCPHAHAWQDAELRPFQATAAQLATAIDSRQQNRLLQERNEQLAVLRERQRIARELHDAVSQLLFSLTLIAQSIEPAWSRDPAEAKRRIQRLAELSERIQREMRALLAELRPAPDRVRPAGGVLLTPLERVRREGLVTALRQHLGEVSPEGLRVVLAADEYARQAPEVEETLFRIAQEAFANAIKHAAARQVTIRLRAAAGEVRLTVRDNGVGFVAPRRAAPNEGRFGLDIMRDRAWAQAGTLRVVSAPGRGTTVSVRLPGGEGQVP
jgi:signal transduction histidine kinase